MNVLAGYQKSGTEWTKFLIAHCILGPQRNWTEYTDAVPNPREDKPMRCGFLKSHEVRIPKEVYGVIYVVRHPFDVCISSYRYRCEIDKNFDGTIHEYIDTFLEHAGDETFNLINGGDWNAHVTYAMSDARYIILPHEQLRHEQGPMMLRNALLHCGFDIKPERVLMAFRTLTPDYMRTIDNRNFLGKIKIGQWQDEFSPAQREAGRVIFEAAASCFGYEL